MKTVSLKVGKKGAREAVKVPLQVPENLNDINELAKGSEAVVVRCFKRGWQIENQERSGARDAFGEGKSEAEIAAIVAGYDPTKQAERAARQPKEPPKVTLTKGKKTYSADDLKALLAAAGVQVLEGETAAV